MSSLLPSSTLCCNPCDEPLSVVVPGPAGNDGENGNDGADGTNAFTTTTAQFTMPAELANVTIDVVTSTPFAVGQNIYIKSGGAAGYFQIISKPSSTQMEIKNLADTSTGMYLVNSVAGTSFGSGGAVSPAGVQGPSGTNGTSGSDLTMLTGEQSPEGITTATVGRLYYDTANKGLYIKDTGSGNTGWRELIG